MTSFWAFPLFTNSLMQRVILVLLSVIYIIAVNAGIISFWSIAFSLFVGLRYRAGLRNLSKRHDSNNVRKLSLYGLYLGLILECVSYMVLSFFMYYFVFLQSLDNFYNINISGLDVYVGFWDWFGGINSFDMADPYESPIRYLVCSSIIQIILMILILTALSARSFCQFYGRVATKGWVINFLEKHSINYIGVSADALSIFVFIPRFVIFIVFYGGCFYLLNWMDNSFVLGLVGFFQLCIISFLPYFAVHLAVSTFFRFFNSKSQLCR